MDLKTIGNLLTHGIFTIPDYQRGYSWGTNQLEEFWDDLVDVEYVSEHYTGTITLIKKEKNEIENGDNIIGTREYPIYDIVDGQQRLTTIHLFLISIYFRLRELNEAEEDIIRHVRYKDKELLRLNNKENQVFFKTLLIEEDYYKITELEFENKTQFNLKNAREYFYNKLHKLNAKKATNLLDNLMSRFKVNIFELRKETEVGLIFETMNDRGLKLSDLDKIKNYLIYLSHRINDNILAKDTNRKFGKIFNELMKISMNDRLTDRTLAKIENTFLQDSVIVYRGLTKDLDDIHKLVKTNIIPKNHLKKDLFSELNPMINETRKRIEDFTSFLLKSSIQYVLISLKEFEDEKVNEYLLKLEKLKKLDSFTPILLSIATGEKKIKKDKLEKIIENLEKFAFRLSFSRRKNNTGISELNSIAYDIYRNKTNLTEVKQKIKDLTIKYSQQEFKETFLDTNIYKKNENNDVIKYFLYEYEAYLIKESNSNNKLLNFKGFFNQTDISIEHIHPQSSQPGEKNLKSVDRIGNLILLKKKVNSRISNRTFNKKKESYQMSDFISVQNIANSNDWDEKNIRERAKKLAKFGNKNWKI